MKSKIDNLYENPEIKKFTFKRLLLHELIHLDLLPSKSGNNLRDFFNSNGHSNDDQVIPRVNRIMSKYYGETYRDGQGYQYIGSRYKIE